MARKCLGVGPGELSIEVSVEEKTGLRAVYRTVGTNGPGGGEIPGSEAVIVRGPASPGGGSDSGSGCRGLGPRPHLRRLASPDVPVPPGVAEQRFFEQLP